jgi:hypothetical protein
MALPLHLHDVSTSIIMSAPPCLSLDPHEKLRIYQCNEYGVRVRFSGRICKKLDKYAVPPRNSIGKRDPQCLRTIQAGDTDDSSLFLVDEIRECVLYATSGIEALCSVYTDSVI